jgi:hypothetical protein
MSTSDEFWSVIILVVLVVMVRNVWHAIVRWRMRRAALKQDKNEKCPGCGWAEGEIECVWVPVREQIMIEHHCLICHCRWNRPPVKGTTPTGADLLGNRKQTPLS